MHEVINVNVIYLHVQLAQGKCQIFFIDMYTYKIEFANFALK
jgi:hypothetical protein